MLLLFLLQASIRRRHTKPRLVWDRNSLPKKILNNSRS
jgi:hypothetical protein